MAHYSPVIIVGAGPVGLSLAIGLSRRGVPSTIIEKAEGLEPYSRAILVPARTLDIFEEWGILGTMIDAGIYVPQLRVYDARSSKLVIAIDFSDLKAVTQTPGFLFLPQDRIERLLLEAVRSSQLSSVRFGAAATGFQQTSEGVTVSVQDHGQSYEISGRFLVGCDGAHSVTRRSLGLSLLGKTLKARVLIADVALSTDLELPTPRLALTASGPLVLLKFDENRWRIVGVVERDETEEEARSEAGVASRVRALAGDVPFRLLWSSTFQIHNRMAQKMRVANVLLAGDAVHLSSPAGGMGMNSGIEDAHNLAWKLALALSRNDANVLDSYETERMYAMKHAVEPTSDVASNTLYFAPWPLRLFFISLFYVIMRIKPARSRILAMMNMLSTKYPPSDIARGDARWVGRIAPNCAITNKPQVRLLEGRWGKAVIVCYDVAAKPAYSDVVYVSAENGQVFRRTWKVRRPFCAVIRPDGFIGWARERPSAGHISDAVKFASEIS